MSWNFSNNYWLMLAFWRDLLATTYQLPTDTTDPDEGDTEEPDTDTPDTGDGGNTEEPDTDTPDTGDGGNTEEPDTDTPDTGDGGDTEEPDTDTPDTGDGGDTEEPDTCIPDTFVPGAGNAPQAEVVSLVSGVTTAVSGGRVTVFSVATPKTITSIDITDGPAHGHVTVNPDNTLALVLSDSDYSGSLSFGFDITYADGATETRSATLDVAAPEQDSGWGEGKHYMLETDAQGDLVIETGENHRKVYVSGSDDALTAADIAAREGVSESTVTGKWLLDHPEYGGSEDMALATDIGMSVWYALTPIQPVPVVASHWLMFEKGHTYEDTGQLFTPGTSGESALQPLYISSWGEGDRPILKDQIKIFQLEGRNIVIDDVAPEGGVMNFGGTNLILNDSEFTGIGINIQSMDGFTLRDSDLHDIVAGDDSGDYWVGASTALFSKNTDGILMEGNIFHHNGWEDDYLPDGSTEGGAPPTVFSHNIYLQNTTTDVTARDNIISQAASVGAQFRGGAFIEDNVFVDNNVAVNMMGGIYEGQGDGPIGNFTLFTDNLVTSGAHKTWTHGSQGGLTLGVEVKAVNTTLLDNIIAHLADPDNPEELAQKITTHDPLTIRNGTAYDDTIIYNWKGGGWVNPNKVTDNGRVTDTDLADQTTIQRFAAQALGQDKATIAELMEAILADEVGVTADDIIAYFQDGFGIDASGNGSASSHRFIPNALADGIRWENRINWSNEELPDAGDSVDLGGNHVYYGGTTVLDDLDLGGGALHVNSGKLSVQGTLASTADAGQIQILNAGQFWTDGYADGQTLTVDVDGGRFANTGEITGQTQLQVSDGQALLATSNASYVLTNGSQLIIDGSDARIGFDGPSSGTAELEMQNGSTLTFRADAGGFATIEEFRSGAWTQQGSGFNSSVTLDGTLRIDLSGYGSGTGSHSLIEVDMLLGALDTIEFTGLGNSRDAELVIDHAADIVLLELSAGNGQTSSRSIDANAPAPTYTPTEMEPGDGGDPITYDSFLFG